MSRPYKFWLALLIRLNAIVIITKLNQFILDAYVIYLHKFAKTRLFNQSLGPKVI